MRGHDGHDNGGGGGGGGSGLSSLQPAQCVEAISQQIITHALARHGTHTHTHNHSHSHFLSHNHGRLRSRVCLSLIPQTAPRALVKSQEQSQSYGLPRLPALLPLSLLLSALGPRCAADQAPTPFPFLYCCCHCGGKNSHALPRELFRLCSESPKRPSVALCRLVCQLPRPN